MHLKKKTRQQNEEGTLCGTTKAFQDINQEMSLGKKGFIQMNNDCEYTVE